MFNVYALTNDDFDATNRFFFFVPLFSSTYFALDLQLDAQLTLKYQHSIHVNHTHRHCFHQIVWIESKLLKTTYERAWISNSKMNIVNNTRPINYSQDSLEVLTSACFFFEFWMFRTITFFLHFFSLLWILGYIFFFISPQKWIVLKSCIQFTFNSQSK